MKKKTIETIAYSTLGLVAMALILVAFNFIASGVKARIDLTKEKAYTLSPGTRAILRKLDTPVKIRLYCTQSETATPETVFLKGYAKRVEDLLAEYKQIAGSKLTIEKYDPQPDSDAEDSARLDGVEGQPLSNGEKFYLGLSVSLLDEKQAIPFLAPNRERLLEYDLSRAISRVVTPEKATVGIMSPMPVFGMPSNPMMQQMGQQGQEPWVLVNELKNDFNVKRVGMDVDKIDDDIKVLMVIHPRDISDKAQFAIDQFILRGGKLMAFLDPLPLIDTKQQNSMLGNMPNSGSSMEKLLKAWGLAFDTSKVVADMNFKMRLGGRNGQPQDAPAFLSVTPDGINTDDIVTGQIDNIWLPFAGAITGTPVAGLKETVLLKSTKDSQLVDGFMANLSGENVIKEFKPSGTVYALAVRLTGKFKTAFPEGKPDDKKDEKKDGDKKADAKPEEKKPNDSLKESQQDTTVILVGDADMLYDHFALRQIQSPFGNMATLMNGNLNFAQNAIEQLTGDNNLITVRSRATQNRPFTLVKKMQSEAEDNFRSKIKEMEDSLADTQRQLNELQQKKDKGQRFILSPEQQAAVENFRKKEAEVKIRLKDERKKLRRDIDSLENRLKWFNIAAMPVLVSASGLTLAFYKRKRTDGKMNRKQFIILLVLVIVIGGAGVLLRKKQTASWEGANPSLGAKLVGAFPVNDVAHINLKQGTNELNLVKKDDLWRVRERDDYPANYSEISDFLLKIRDLKIVQSEKVGPSQLPKLALVPGSGSNSALVVDFKDQSDKTLKSLLLGKKHMKKSDRPSPYPGMGDEGWPDGRYVKLGGNSDEVDLISDAMSNIEPTPAQWLNKDFFKVEKVRSVAVEFPQPTNSWKLSRETESGEWKLADAKPGEQLDSSKASSVANPLNSPSFNDVASASKTDSLGLNKPTVVTLDTFEDFAYTVKVGTKTNEVYPLMVAVSAQIPKERTAGKDEKPADKDKLDKEFKEKQKKLEEKLAQEKSYEKWIYLVSNWTLDPLLKERSQLMVEKKEPKKDEKSAAATEAKPAEPLGELGDPKPDEK